MKKIIFMGTPDFSVPILEALTKQYEVVLVVTQPDRPKGRKKILSAPPVKEKALKLNLPVFQPEKIKNEMDELFKYKADIIVTAAFGQLLPKQILEFPPFGCINVHASLLPELRGGAPIHYAILQGKKETGVTIMYMAEKLDAGDIISQESVVIQPSDNVGTLHHKLSEIGCALLIETLPQIFEQTVNPVKQNEKEATYAPNISREIEKIDWSQSDELNFNKVRGLYPWPTAYTTHEGKRLKILEAVKTDRNFTNKMNGEIVSISNEGLEVVCGNDKTLLIKKIQLAGKKQMTIQAFIQGHPETFKNGVILGTAL